MRTRIYLKELHIHQINSNAGVFYGENSIRGWQARAKGNSSVGRVNGDHNSLTSYLTSLNDPDVIDMAVKTGE